MNACRKKDLENLKIKSYRTNTYPPGTYQKTENTRKALQRRLTEIKTFEINTLPLYCCRYIPSPSQQNLSSFSSGSFRGGSFKSFSPLISLRSLTVSSFFSANFKTISVINPPIAANTTLRKISSRGNISVQLGFELARYEPLQR